VAYKRPEVKAAVDTVKGLQRRGVANFIVLGATEGTNVAFRRLICYSQPLHHRSASPARPAVAIIRSI